MVTLIIPAALAAAIPAIIGLIGGTVSTLAGRIQNKKNVQAQKEQNQRDQDQMWAMYDKQRQDALADWNRTNSYNDPLQQMIRLKQAGLSPHLVYGKGAETTAAMIRGSSSNAQSKPAPKIDNGYLAGASDQVQSGLMQGLQTKQIQAQTDNLYESNKLMQKEGILKDAQTAKILVETKGGQTANELALKNFDANVKKSLLENSRIESDIAQKQASTQFTLDANQRAALLNSTNVQKTLAEIIQLKQTTAKTEWETANLSKVYQNLMKEGYSKELENLMKQIQLEGMENGVMTTDSPAWRALLKFLGWGEK